MINDVPSIIYDKNKNPLRVIKSSRVFFKKHGRVGYVFHVEREERITSVSEFDLVENNGNFFVTKDIFENSDMM
ncbi:hypothetical protein [Clostridium sp. UBA5119]|uniref:hypothetical protein n=1 Tax=Clostridium sp. UBA5119 TaxID=1946366 RepID=UPI0032174AB6